MALAVDARLLVSCVGGAVAAWVALSCVGDDPSPGSTASVDGGVIDASPATDAEGPSESDGGATAVCPDAAILCDDFESGDFRRWEGPPIAEAPSRLDVDSLGPPRRGSFGLHFATERNEVDGAIVRTSARLRSKAFDEVTAGTLAVRFYMLAPTVPSQATTLFWFSKGPQDGAVSVLYVEQGKWAAQSVGGTIDGATFAPSAVAIASNRWTCVEWVVDVGVAGRQQIFLDGSPAPVLVSEMDTVGSTARGYAHGSFLMNNQGPASQHLFFDDVVLATFAGRAEGPRIGCGP
ncbi:MAG: hypothetical protein KF764_09165 [Labilithrix sp.]|nr:hypothetical protein [Labilithrix sp.]MBX3224736.1 hypothetical protein [Labilithrix sp.]